MAKKKHDNPNANSTVTGPWKFSRPIGLARALMKAGYGTRKQTAQMIADGRISVDEEVVLNPNLMLEPGSRIFLDEEPLSELKHSYLAFHKPVRTVCSPSDGAEKRLVSDYFPRDIPGLQTAGRLDARTSGLLLISNDRPWNNLVTGSSTLEQEYRFQVAGELTDLEISVMGSGVILPSMGLFKPLSVKVVEILNGRTVVNMVVREGKIRQVRRMLSTLRHKVLLVRRIRVGSIRLGDLPVGGIRHLTPGEVHSIVLAGPVKEQKSKGKKGEW